MNSLEKRNQFIIIVLTALLAGSLDISAAFINSLVRAGTSLVIVLQYIASGMLGPKAFSGGWMTAFLGLASHYFITFVWTFLFFKLYPLLKIKSKYQIPAGLIYGIIIWVIMNFIVLPNSGVRQFPFRVPKAVLGISFIMFLIGLPISLMFHKFSSYDSGKAV